MPAARAADSFCAAAPLQPACPLHCCCRPAARPPAPAQLPSLFPPGSCWGGCVLGCCWGQETVPSLGRGPRGDTHPQVQQPVQGRPGTSPEQGPHALTHALSGGLPQHPPLAAILPLPQASHLQRSSRHDTAHTGGSLPQVCEPAAPNTGGMALLPGPPAPQQGCPAPHGCSPPAHPAAAQVHSLQELRRSASLATKVFVQRDYSDGTTCQFQTKFPPELESRVGSLAGGQGGGCPMFVPYGVSGGRGV